MISIRHRKYLSFIINPDYHQSMIDWKIASREIYQPLPGDLLNYTMSTLHSYFTSFDCITVPAPSFHAYDHYPIWILAQQISQDLNIPAVNLFPTKSGKTKMMVYGSVDKQVQNIHCNPGLFVLILDDIYTTGHTMRVTIEAIIKKGSYACGVTLA